MRGSVLILTLFIMVAMSMLLVTAFAIAESHFAITRNNNLHQEAFYLAESGMGYAQNKLHNIIMQSYEECLSEFQWDPLEQPTYSLQESASEYMEDNLGPKINRMLQDMELHNNFPVPQIPGLQPDSKMNIQIKFTDIYMNPSRLLISSRADIGDIRRRIDAEIHINKVSKIYDSYLFDKVLLSGGDIHILSGGELECFGSLHIQGGMDVLGSSKSNIHKLISVGEDIIVSNNSQAFFNGDVICSGLYVNGEGSSFVKCSNDVYSYSVISADYSGNTIQINGKLHINPEEESISAGISATNGGNIHLKNEIFINGTLQYETEAQYLFGIEHIPVKHGIYHSNESIGGENQNFYFPKFTPEYARNFFIPGFDELDRQEQRDLIYAYINTPPDSEQDMNRYLQHLNEMDLASIYMDMDGDSLLNGYTSGLIFANNQVMEPLRMPDSEAFFEDILKKMKFETSWDYNNQINSNVSVPLSNAIVEGENLLVLDPDQSIVCIIPEDKDLYLPSGEYGGIIITNGSIHIPLDSDIVFNGLLIAGENVFLEGNLALHEDKDLLLDLLGSKDNAVSQFFRIKQEKPLFEIISCSESLYRKQW